MANAGDWRRWRQGWASLKRQEAELDADTTAAAAAAPPPGSARRAPPPARPAPFSQAQLARHLGTVQALCGAASKPGGALRRAQATQTALEAAAADELARLQPLEAEAAAEWEAAAAHVQQLLLATPRTAREEPAGCSSAPAADGATSARRRSSVAGGPPVAAVAAAAQGSDQPPEVAAYDAFLQRHGPTGGWHPDDHAEFERLLRACHGSYAHCVQLAAAELGLLHGQEEVARHARWHEELQRLQLAKRMAVQRWRAQRQADQAAALERQQAEAAAQREAAERAGAAAARQAAAQHKEQQRAAVQEWRAAREQQAAQASAQQEAQERERLRQEQLARQARQQENRLQLQQRRQLKQEQAALAGEPSAEATCSSSAAVDPAVRQRLRERNAQLLARRSQQVQARGAAAAAAAERAEALARAAAAQGAGAWAERDPARLLQPTSAAALRQLAALSEERAPRDSGFIRHVSRRATPSWCGGARLQ